MILLLHWLSWAVWLGAQLTFMVWGPVARRAPLPSWALAWDTLSRVQRWIVAPACAVATVTGIALSMQYHDNPNATGSGVIAMQILGLVAAVLTLFLVTPWVNRMAYLAARSVEKGALDERAEPVRKRLALVASISGICIILAVYFAVPQ